METAEYRRWVAYCQKYREPARSKMLQLFSHLTGQDQTSAAGLATCIQGNANDRVRIAQALIDGEIVRVNGRLQLPNARPEQTLTESELAYDAVMGAVWAWARTLPTDSAKQRRAVKLATLIDSFFDEDIDDEDDSGQDEDTDQ